MGANTGLDVVDELDEVFLEAAGILGQAVGQALDLGFGEGVDVGAGFEGVEVAAWGAGASGAKFVVEVGAAVAYPMCPHIGYGRAWPSCGNRGSGSGVYWGCGA